MKPVDPQTKWIVGVVAAGLVASSGLWVMSVANAAQLALERSQEQAVVNVRVQAEAQSQKETLTRLEKKVDLLLEDRGIQVR